MDQQYDIIVVGAGVCGAVAAYILAKGKKRVVLIEAGPDITHSRAERALEFAVSTNKHPASPYMSVGPGYVVGPDSDPGYYAFDPPKNTFKSTFLRMVGGSTWHFLGNVPRFVPADFELTKRYGLGEGGKNIDWPLKYNDLEKHYCRAEREMGVSADDLEWENYLDASRSEKFPMTKIWQSYGDHFFIDKLHGTKVFGETIQIKATPQARNSTIYDGRPACSGNSSCVPICPVQAKYDATVHVKKAVSHGAVMLHNSLVTSLKAEGSGKIIELEYTNTLTRHKTSLDTSKSLVILAAHAIETPRLLLYSGIANGSGLVGKNLMDHLQGYVLADATVPIFPFRGPITTSGIDVFRDTQKRRDFAAFRLSIGNDGWGRTESPASSLLDYLNKGLYGKDLVAQVADRVTKKSRISFSTEMLPEECNAVTLSNIQDSFGIPKPKTIIKLSDYNVKAMKYAYRVGEEMYRILGWSTPPMNDSDLDARVRNYSGAGHIMGTTKMGTDPKTSVVDVNGKAHDHQNLYIVGPSVFPTSGTANPTLTAVALTIKSAESILSREIPT